MEEKWKKFSLSEEEKGILAVSSQEVSDSKQHAKFSLLFKLQARNSTRKLSNPPFRNYCVVSTVLLLKRLETTFFWLFLHEDTEEVIDRSPWSFDRGLILLKQFKGNLSPGDVSFQHSLFWIRVFNIPIKSMNSCVGTRMPMRLVFQFWLMPRRMDWLGVLFLGFGLTLTLLSPL